MATSDPAAPGPARRAAAYRTAALLVIASGCSGSGVAFAPVEGTVTRNGRPVPRAQVIFFADEAGRGPRAVGLTDDAGRYRLAADDGRDGAPVGKHRVCVIDTTLAAERLGLVAKQVSPEAGGKAAPPKSANKTGPIPPEYGRPAETPLRADVKPGPQAIDFQLP